MTGRELLEQVLDRLDALKQEHIEYRGSMEEVADSSVPLVERLLAPMSLTANDVAEVALQRTTTARRDATAAARRAHWPRQLLERSLALGGWADGFVAGLEYARAAGEAQEDDE